MSNSTKVVVDNSSIFTTLLAVLFIGLKLTGHIDWSWWWVLSPLWIPFALVLTIGLIIGIPWFVRRAIQGAKS